MTEVLTINGDVGGGQVVRNAFVYAALMCQPITLYNIRATRTPPGLRPQHLTGVRVINEMSGGRLTGDEVGTSEVTFLPTRFVGGNFTADTTTAGSITLLLQITLPCMLYAPRHGTLVLKGGTDVQFAPPLDEMRCVFAPLLKRWFGVDCNIQLRRRGFYPRGRGEVQVVVHRPLSHCLPGICAVDRGALCRFRIHAFAVGDREAQDLQQLVHCCAHFLRQRHPEVEDVETDARVIPPDRAADQATGVTVVAETTTGCLFGASRFRDRKSWVPGPQMGAEVAQKLCAELSGGGCVDQWTQDQLIIFMCLAQGLSRLRVAQITEHTQSAMELAQRMTAVQWDVQRDGDTCIISCDGIGLQPSAGDGRSDLSPPVAPDLQTVSSSSEAELPQALSGGPSPPEPGQHDVKPQRDRRRPHRDARGTEAPAATSSVGRHEEATMREVAPVDHHVKPQRERRRRDR